MCKGKPHGCETDCKTKDHCCQTTCRAEKMFPDLKGKEALDAYLKHALGFLKDGKLLICGDEAKHLVSKHPEAKELVTKYCENVINQIKQKVQLVLTQPDFNQARVIPLQNPEKLKQVA